MKQTDNEKKKGKQEYMQTLLDRDKKGNERNYEWKKEVHDRSCYRTRKKGCSM